ncbi:hypothetical protein MKX03_009893, partial [Papaver bracteatum]
EKHINKLIFQFQKVALTTAKNFDPTARSDDGTCVFVDASPMVVSILDGYNVCIFAYGKTGTGNMFTMYGPEHYIGVNYRTLELLFNRARVGDTASFRRSSPCSRNYGS